MKVRNILPAQNKDAGSKQDAPHVAWQRLGAPKQTHAQILPFPSGSTGLTELPAFPSWETPAAPLSHATLEHISMPLSAHRSRDHLCHPLTWGLSS